MTEPPLCCHYGGGPWLAVAGPRTWLLADVDPTGPAMAGCWELVRQDADPADVVAALLRDGFRAVDNFVLAHAGIDGCHVVVRGTAWADLAAGAGSPASVRATGLTSWAEHHFTMARHPAVRLCGPAATDSFALPLVVGVVAAGWIELSLREKEICFPAPVVEPPVEVVPPIEVTPVERGLDPTKFDHMFGATIHPPDPAPVPPAEPLDEVAPAPVVELERGGMITAMPRWDGEPGVETTSVREPVGQSTHAVVLESAATVNRAALRAAVRQQQGGPTVQAVRCTVGHPSPVHASVCRVCGVALERQQPTVVSRPVLGTLRLSTGEHIPLDRGVLLGRAPTTDNESAPDRPHVLRLGGASDDVSRNHVEITLEDWTVLVTDLGSANGTVITAPGRLPERLRADVPQAIEPGTVVSLADEITFRFEVAG
jgi:hypothetical protein